MSYNLFLDDERNPWDVSWVNIRKEKYRVVRNFAEFVSCITALGVPDYVTFDHDLADDHYKAMQIETMQMTSMFGGAVEVDYGHKQTGYDCAKWLVEHCHTNKRTFPQYNVHSLNPVGSERIRSYIESSKKCGFIC